MVYGRSIAIGGGVLAVVILLSAVIFYLSLGPCPRGTFACDNGEKCVPQWQICNNYNNCADGSDEQPLVCGLLYGSKEMTDRLVANALERNRLRQELQANVSVTVSETALGKCIVASYPKECSCRYMSVVGCNEEAQLSQIPFISPEITFLLIKNNNLTLHDGCFEHMGQLQRLSLKSNNISELPLGSFGGLPNLKSLDMRYNKLDALELGVLRDLPMLQYLFLSRNGLRRFTLRHLMHLPQLVWLKLTGNLLRLRNERFPRMQYLLEVYLDSNLLEWIDEHIFAQLDTLQLLDLNDNRIGYIHPKAFWGLTNLRDIRLIGNPLKSLSADFFEQSNLLDALSVGNLQLRVGDALLNSLNISFLNLTTIRFEHIEFEAISSLANLKYIVFDHFYFCSMIPQVRMCKPFTDGVSSFRDLLSKPVLRYSAWIMASITIVGNVMVLLGRFIYRDENIAVTMVIRNLALADILMGFYLVTIGFIDYSNRDEYHKFAMGWITSWQCAAIGSIAVTSAEVSMLILAFMSLERFLLIADPFRGHHRLSVRNICMALASIWIMGVGLAVAPVVLWHSSTKFYGTYSGTCFPLHIQEPYPLGWQYSAFMFLGVNLLLLVMIAVLYTTLLISIWRTRSATPLSLLDCEFAVRFFFIVLTDMLCWAPIIIVKIWVFFNYNISDDIYAWLVVFILPLNSAVNPLLYTFTTPKYRNQILIRGWKKITNRRRMEPSNGMATTIGTATGSSNPDEFSGKAIPLVVNH